MERQYQMYLKESRLAEISRKQTEMEKEEEKLFFFDRLNEYESRKEQKKKEWRKTFPPQNWKGRITLKPRKNL